MTVSLVEHSLVIRKVDADEHQRRIARIEEALRSGAHVSTAAAYAGIVPGTLARWVKEGRRLREILDAVEQDPDDDREPSPSELELIWLAQTVDRAEAEAEVGLVKALHETAQPVLERRRPSEDGDGWDVEIVSRGLDADGIRSAAFLLERRFKDRWAKRSETTGAGGGPVEVEDVTVRRETLDAALDAVRKRLEAKQAALETDEVEVMEVTREG